MKRFRPPSSKLSIDKILDQIYDDLNEIGQLNQSEKSTGKRNNESDFRFIHDKSKNEYAIEVKFKDGWKRFVAQD